MKDLKPMLDALKARKARQEAVKAKYKDKGKAKTLTTAERLDRIEEMLGLKE